MRLVAIDYFRAISIGLIVAGHSYSHWLLGFPMLDSLVNGGTSLFVFISGFFFHHTFIGNFNYFCFLKKKAKSVLAPYFLLSSLAFFLYVFLSRPLPFSEQLDAGYLVSFSDYIVAAVRYLWTGRILTPYWYIPFICLVFILSPAFIAYARLSLNFRLAIFFAALVFAMVAHRPLDNLSPLHSLVYFSPIYLLGINYSMHKGNVDRFIESRFIFLGVLVLFFAFVQAYVFELHGNYRKKEIFSFNGFDVIILQKIALCFFLLSLLKKLELRNIPFLKFLAASSFAVFFIHPWVIAVIGSQGLNLRHEFLQNPSLALMLFPLVLGISLAFAYLLKVSLRGMSAYVIGW